MDRGRKGERKRGMQKGRDNSSSGLDTFNKAREKSLSNKVLMLHV